MGATGSPIRENGGERRRVLGAFARLSGGFWHGDTARAAWLLTVGLGALVILNIGVNVALNRWNRWFFDALEMRDAVTALSAVLVYGGLVVVVAGVGVAIVLTRETLQVRWRQWLTGDLVARWLADRRYFRMGLARTEPANPEYRIADDTRMATEPIVDFFIGLINALLTALAFVGILWTVGGALTLDIGGLAVTIPAYLVIAALVYGSCASLLMLWVGRPLIDRVVARNEAEARLRFELTRLRENAESIAIIGGERDERAILGRTYGLVVERFLAVVRQHGRLTWITNANGALVPVIPLLLATPKYLSGELSLGAVVQLVAAFGQVQVAVAWLVENYRAIAQCYASAKRVTDLSDAMEAIGAQPSGAAGSAAIVAAVSADGQVRLHDLTIGLRNGRVLIAPVSLTIAPGEKVLITGESGIGKSTLVRAIAGLWPWGSGSVHLPEGARIAFVPQRPYLPLGTLRDVLTYPEQTTTVSDEAMIDALGRCGLDTFAGRLGEVERWDQVPSSGERQRLAFARLILQKPDIAILDEATAALDTERQASLMTLLNEALPDTTVISVGHRPGLESYHDRTLVLRRQATGASIHVVHANDTRHGAGGPPLVLVEASQ